jgi:hypothetical protein
MPFHPGLALINKISPYLFSLEYQVKRIKFFPESKDYQPVISRKENFSETIFKNN